MPLRGKSGAALLAAALLSGVCPAAADPYYPSKIETPDLRLVYYSPIDDFLTPYVGQAYENSFAFQRKTFGWTPWEKPTVYLRDLSDGGNAAASPTPLNALTVDIAPISTVFETYYHGERVFTLMNHELVHIATLDVWNDDDAFWRNFFHGKPQPVTTHPETILYNYLAQPRTWEPRWYREGIAVFMETWMDGGLGRAQGGYDEMVFRAMVRDNAHFYNPVGLESEGVAVDFQTLSNDYLYGTRFDSYLALTYGPEKLVALHQRGNDSKAYYADQFEHIFGKPLDAAWGDWIAFEHDWQKKNLAALAKYPLTPRTLLTPHGLGSMSRSFYDPKTDSLIVGFRPVGQLGNIGLISLKDGHERKLTDFQGPALYRVTSLAYDPAERKAYFTSDNNGFRNLLELDIDSGQTRMLLKHARIGDIAFNQADKSIWGIRHLNGLDTLVRVRAAHDDWNQVNTFPFGQDVFDLDISPDGKLLCATVNEINGQSFLDVFRISDLLAGKVDAIATLALGNAIPEGGAFSPDGRYVYVSAYYTGVSNIYRLDITRNAYDAVSNTDTGFFRPLPMADGSLIVDEFTGEGFRPVRIEPKPLTDLGTIRFLGAEIADRHPVVKSWAVGSPANVPFDSMVTEKGSYKAQDEMVFDGSYPIIEGYRGHVAGGWHAQWEDPLQNNLLSMNVAYSPAGDLKDGQELHGDVTYRTLNWHFTYWHNNASFYDLFGPTDYSRKGDALLGGYHNVLLYDPPQILDYSIDGGLYSDLDVLPGAQNIASHDTQIAMEKFTITYSDIEQSLGAVDNEAGYRATLTLLGNYAKDEFFPQAHAGFDFGVALPWNHASVWLYNSAGISGGDRSNALDYYYMGAFGNNYVDSGEIKRYRNFDSFPGFEIDEIAPSDFVKSTLEFNLPPIRFEDIGTSAFFLSSARTALFTGILEADPGLSTQRTFEDVGFQMDWNFTIAERLPMTLSFGDALGFADGRGTRNEIMVSLKIL